MAAIQASLYATSRGKNETEIENPPRGRALKKTGEEGI
jgi:hypothetical protein